MGVDQELAQKFLVVEVLSGCGDKTRTQKKVCEIFNTKYPNRRISQSTASSKVFGALQVAQMGDGETSLHRLANLSILARTHPPSYTYMLMLIRKCTEYGEFLNSAVDPSLSPDRVYPSLF
ncbi:hypothetical protein NQ318_003846 [Aromia moschata]|uniref:DUF4817 domain-containing protein n=1 Tax=Aromia moschata TaxID=1265417 RepID=A0AAV8Z850_9CUCU|nr:hypothetical protein NQ318_003846 [Aromia moschata]